MPKRKKVETTCNEDNQESSPENLSVKIINFYQRWNIHIDQQEVFNDFKRRTLNSLLTLDEINVQSIFTSKELKKEYLKIIGELPEDEYDLLLSQLSEAGGYRQEKIFNLLNTQQDFMKYLFYLQAIFWLKTLTTNEKNEIYKRFQNDIACSQVQINLIKTDKDILFYPAGAKFLDTALINDMLVWMVKYPDVYENFKNALEKYTKKIYQRNLVDNLRLALELLIKHILKNEKTLENQKQGLGQYLKNKGIASEIRNLYIMSIDYYAKYQNNYAKHNDNVNETEIEFILYLTGTFIRFLLVTESLQLKP